MFEQTRATEEQTLTRDNFGYTRAEVSVEYYNPSTGTRSYHNLEVEFDDGQVDTIHFPNGGWMDSDHISDQIDNGDGTITVVNEHGYEYTVEKPYPEYGNP